LNQLSHCCHDWCGFAASVWAWLELLMPFISPSIPTILRTFVKGSLLLHPDSLLNNLLRNNEGATV
jgi:hypothetical protein